MATIREQVTAAFNQIEAQQPDAIQTGTIQQPAALTGGGPSDTTGGTAGSAPTPVSARMAVFEIDEQRVDGTNILAGDWQVIIEPTSIEITLKDKITVQQGELSIIKLGRIAPSGETVAYDMVCRS